MDPWRIRAIMKMTWAIAAVDGVEDEAAEVEADEDGVVVVNAMPVADADDTLHMAVVTKITIRVDQRRTIVIEEDTTSNITTINKDIIISRNMHPNNSRKRVVSAVTCRRLPKHPLRNKHPHPHTHRHL